MPNLVTNQFKIVNAKNFIAQFSDSNNSLYLFLAKPSIWSTESELPNDPVDTQPSYFNIWDEMISLKKINPVNIVSVVKRINWVRNSVYAEYSHDDANLYLKNYYVINREYDVYKCIDNAKETESTIEPTGKSLNIFSTSDGYKWKYLYTVSTSDRLKFLTDNWMPVRLNEDVAAVAKDGAIENIKIINGGIDYSIRANVIITGDGIGANITARQSLGVIYDFNYINTGTRYRFAKAVLSDSNSNGRSANIKAILSPLGGHGSDPISELNSNYIMINVRTTYNEGYGDFPAGFSYRKLGIIRNPKDITGNVASSSTLSSLNGLSLTNSNGTFLNNEFIEGLVSGANAYVVTANIVTGNGYIKHIQSNDLTYNFKNFTIGEQIVGMVSGATATVSNTLLAEVISDTGEILYIENKYPITKLPDQTDSLHLVLEF
jgi:hypothetical protein